MDNARTRRWLASTMNDASGRSEFGVCPRSAQHASMPPGSGAGVLFAHLRRVVGSLTGMALTCAKAVQPNMKAPLIHG